MISLASPSFGEDVLVKAEKMLKQNRGNEEAKQLIAHFLTEQESAQAYMKVGTLYARLREWPSAVHYLDIASARNEKSSLIWYELAIAQHQNKMVDAAVTSLRRAAAISPKTEKIYWAMGEMLELSRDKYDARNIYLTALSKVGNRPHFHSRLCWLNSQDNFFEQTISQCKMAVKGDASDIASWAILARTYYLDKQRPQALDILKKAIQLFPKGALLYRARGLIYFEEKAYEQAINDLGKAFGLDANDDEAAIYLARSYFELGYYDRALPIYIEACKLDRDYRFEFLAKQRELSRKGSELADAYQEAVDKF